MAGRNRPAVSDDLGARPSPRQGRRSAARSSPAARIHVRGKVKLGFDDLGEHQLRNIADSVQIYRLCPGGEAAVARSALPLPDKPSIAVLPFQNLTGDTSQE